MEARDAWLLLGRSRPVIREVSLLQSKKGKAGVWRLMMDDPEAPTLIAKRCTATEARREEAVYEHLLPQLGVVGLELAGSVIDDDDHYAWLFIEDAGGEPYSGHDHTHACLASRWLGRVHSQALQLAGNGLLPVVDQASYFNMLLKTRRRLETARSGFASSPADLEHLARLEQVTALVVDNWPRFAKASARYPLTLAHGSFGSRNMRIQTAGNARHLMVFDWGAARWEMPARDIAKLLSADVSGDISEYRVATEGRLAFHDDESVRDLALLGSLFRALEHVFWFAPDQQSAWWPGQLESLVRNQARLRASASAYIDFVGA